MRSEYASSPTRGSRFVGLLSMIITRVSGSGLPPQERRGRSEKRPDRIFCSTAGDDEFVVSSFSQHKALQCVGNRPYCQRGCSGHDISGFGTPTLFYEVDRKLAAELLAARGLWRLPAEKRLAQDVGYYVFKRSPGSRDFPIAIIWLAEQMFGDGIDNHVPGSGVEGKYLFRRCAGRNRSEVRDTANVLRNSSEALIAVEEIIEKRNQGRALPVGHHVRRPEIGDDGNTHAGCYYRRLSGLPRNR